MKQRLKTFVKKLIKKMIFQLMEEIKEEHLKDCYSKVVIDSESKIYPESIINNFQNDRKKITIGKNVHIRGNLKVLKYGGSIKFCDYSYLGCNSSIWSGEKIFIGKYVLISDNTFISDTNSHEIDPEKRIETYMNLLKEGPPSEKGAIETSPIIIEDYSWISYGCIILKGVRIGKCSIIGAGSVVTKSVPPYTFVAGNPAQVIRELDDRYKTL